MRALKWFGGAVLVLFVAIVLFFTFGLNTLRGPIERAVTEVSGRELVIGDLKAVWSWVHPRIRMEGVRFANADWGSADYLLDAGAIEASLSVLPLFIGRVVLPEVHLERATLALEMDADGRKNWILKDDPEEQDKPSRFFIKRLTLDEGVLLWEDGTRDTSLETALSSDETGVTFKSQGRYQGMKATAVGQAGHVLSVRDVDTPFPLSAEFKIGDTSAKLQGTITGLVGFKGIDLTFERLSGKTMAQLYDIIGLAFPRTSPYRVSGRLYRTDGTWRFEKLSGKVGESDIAGTIEVQTAPGKRPFMRGDVTAKVLNFADLGALVGTDQPREGVLPDMPFSPERWESVDADVRIKAGTIKRPKQLPIDRFETRVYLRDKVLKLDPLAFGIAGGRLAGTVKLDGNKEPMRGDINMRVQNLQLAKMFPTVKQAQGSIGDLNGLIELSGTGESVGKLLGTSNGKIGVYMDEGKISRFMMELVALDVWDAVRVKLKGDEQIDIRCVIGDFGVKDGLMQTNAIVFDTKVVNVGGGGTVNLKTEEMDLTFKPQPKDRSLASLKTPLYVRGTFGQPEIGPDMGRLAAKGAGAILMGVLNPLLAILPLMEEGKGKDSPCAELIAQATKSKNPKPAATAKATAEEPKKPAPERSSASGATAPRGSLRPAK